MVTGRERHRPVAVPGPGRSWGRRGGGCDIDGDGARRRRPGWASVRPPGPRCDRRPGVYLRRRGSGRRGPEARVGRITCSSPTPASSWRRSSSATTWSRTCTSTWTARSRWRGPCRRTAGPGGQGDLVLHLRPAAGATQLGSGPLYAVTKHAVVALADGVHHHGDQGILVSCLCPQAVCSTNLGDDRPAGRPWTPATWSDEAGRWRPRVDGRADPDQAAARRHGRRGGRAGSDLLHPEAAMYERRRADDRERWLRGMRQATNQKHSSQRNQKSLIEIIKN